jgi:CheY-like chemotaxis protein
MITNSDILGARILIVDDQHANVRMLQRLLADAGYSQVTATMLPAEVCALHRLHDFDLILLDLQMPEMDGFQVMECLKTIERDPYLPVIVLTSQPGHKLRADCRGQGLHQQATGPDRGPHARPQHARGTFAVPPAGVAQPSA